LSSALSSPSAPSSVVGAVVSVIVGVISVVAVVVLAVALVVVLAAASAARRGPFRRWRHRTDKLFGRAEVADAECVLFPRAEPSSSPSRLLGSRRSALGAARAVVRSSGVPRASPRDTPLRGASAVVVPVPSRSLCLPRAVRHSR